MHAVTGRGRTIGGEAVSSGSFTLRLARIDSSSDWYADRVARRVDDRSIGFGSANAGSANAGEQLCAAVEM